MESNMTETLTRKQLPVGTDSFDKLMTLGRYYIDKTPYLKNVFRDDGSEVLLITRPRRFGKTMTLSMFECFLGIGADGNRNLSQKESLFSGLEIMKDRDFVEEYMGRFPVISLSLKSVSGDDFEGAYKKLAGAVRTLALKYKYLGESPALSDSEREDYRVLCEKGYLSDQAHSDELQDSLRVLTYSLFRHFNRPVVLLIDEYDVPLAKAAEKGYHPKMVTLISGLFDLLKGSSSSVTGDNSGAAYLYKTVMTGCLKVAKNSIFTGVNNFSVNTVLSNDPKFSSVMGFTKAETERILKDYDLEEYADLVRTNYDGYRFYKDEIFCPWDVVNFVDKNHVLKMVGDPESIMADNYWNTSTSSGALKGYLGYLTENDNIRMQELMDGHEIEISVNDSMNYDDLSMHRSEDFWSLLVHTGYLTSVKNLGEQRYQVRIPNLEIRQCFRENIQNFFDESLQVKDGNRAEMLAGALLSGKVNEADEIIYDVLQSYVSIRDNATRAAPENLYQGLLLGIFSNCPRAVADFKSNSESGRGYADITFKDPRRRIAVVIEIKSVPEEQMVGAADAALTQIKDRDYARPFLKNEMITDIYAYAAVFSGKQSLLKMLKIK